MEFPFVREQIKLTQRAAQVSCGGLFIHGLADQIGVHIGFLRPGFLGSEPAVFQLDASRDDLFLFQLELIDHFFDLVSLRGAWVAVHEGAEAVLNELLILFGGHQVHRGHQLAEFLDLHLLGLLLQNAARGDLSHGDEFLIHDFGGDLVLHEHAFRLLLQNGALEFLAILEGDNIGAKQAGGGGG